MSEPTNDDLRLLAWGMCIALSELQQELAEKELLPAVVGAGLDSWCPALRSHEAFLGWAVAHEPDDAEDDEKIEAAIKWWDR